MTTTSEQDRREDKTDFEVGMEVGRTLGRASVLNEWLVAFQKAACLMTV